MEHLIHRTPSVGGLIKKLTENFPDLSAPELTEILRAAVRVQGRGEFAHAQVIDEELALELAARISNSH
jgi:hypothetical protein